MTDAHIPFLTGSLGGSSFIHYDVFSPLSVAEYRAIGQNEDVLRLADDQINRLWLLPVQRRIQEEFRIDQRNYGKSTDPTLLELTEDFTVAAALAVDKFGANQDELRGKQSVSRAGNITWDESLPMRSIAILERYRRLGSKIARS